MAMSIKFFVSVSRVSHVVNRRNRLRFAHSSLFMGLTEMLLFWSLQDCIHQVWTTHPYSSPSDYLDIIWSQHKIIELCTQCAHLWQWQKGISEEWYSVIKGCPRFAGEGYAGAVQYGIHAKMWWNRYRTLAQGKQQASAEEAELHYV